MSARINGKAWKTEPTGICSGIKLDKVYDTRSTDGYVEITRVTPDFVESNIESNATEVNNMEMTNQIRHLYSLSQNDIGRESKLPYML